MDRTVMPGEFYRHFKNKLYQVKQIAYHSETKEKMVVYQALYGDYRCYVRPYDMFVSEVDHVKYPSVTQKYRFEKVEPEEFASGSDSRVLEIREIPEPATQGHLTGEQSSQTRVVSDNDTMETEAAVNPALIQFLDAPTYREKLNVLTAIRSKMDDRLVNDIATSMDITVEEGDIDQRFLSLKSCVLMHAKYEESNRLR